jgi:hypothetical protein
VYDSAMSNLDATIDRLRALPESQKDAIAAQIDLLLDQDAEDLLSDAEWAEIEARLDAEDATIPHAEVVTRFNARFGK